jgi:hypothetical protein
MGTWEQIMSLLKKIRTDEKKQRPEIFTTPDLPKPEPPQAEISDRCPACNGEDFWQPLGSGDPMCSRCQPAPAESRVRYRFFTFRGERWIIRFQGDQEYWTKESHWEPGMNSDMTWPGGMP